MIAVNILIQSRVADQSGSGQVRTLLIPITPTLHCDPLLVQVGFLNAAQLLERFPAEARHNQTLPHADGFDEEAQAAMLPHMVPSVPRKACRIAKRIVTKRGLKRFKASLRTTSTDS